MKNGDGLLIEAAWNKVDRSDARAALNFVPRTDIDLSVSGTVLAPECDDEVLMRCVQARQPDALECLHARYRELVMSVAVGILPDVDDAQEVVQDVFFELWTRAGNFDARRGKLRGWIGASTHRRAIDRYRSVRRRSTGHEAIRQEWDRAGRQHRNSGDAISCAEATMADESKMLLGIVNTLPPEQAQVVLLTYFMEMSQREVARHLQVSLGTVKHRLGRAMRALTSQSMELRAKLARDR